MELNKYIFPLRKWWWLLCASTLIAAVFGSLGVMFQPTTYQAHSTLLIGTTISNPNPSSSELLLGQQLAAAYADLANRELVRNATASALGMHQLPEYLARALPNTQLIEITVNDTDPKRAQTVANELANQLILLSPLSAKTEEQGRQTFIHERLNSLEADIKETESQINKLKEDLGFAFSAQDISDKNNQISSLQTKLTTMENDYGLLLSNSQKGAINTLSIVASASLPTQPIGPMKGVTILLAAAAGFVLAASEAYLLEFLDDTLKSPDEVERLFSAPVIGRILEQADGMKEGSLYDGSNPGDPLTEPFRVLRAGILFAERRQPLKTILISSPDTADGKSSVAANLALALGERNKRVVLIDADLRKPKLHAYYKLSNENGWADLLSGHDALDWKTVSQAAGKVAVLPAGNPPSDPAGLLSSERMDQFLAQLKQVADVIIIDGPPLFVADAMILASKVDGVLVVVRPGRTRRDLAKASMQQIQLAAGRVIGVVLNRIPLRGADYYAGRSYLYSYYPGSAAERQGSGKKSFSGSIVQIDLERARAFLSPYTHRVSKFIRRSPRSA